MAKREIVWQNLSGIMQSWSVLALNEEMYKIAFRKAVKGLQLSAREVWTLYNAYKCAVVC